MNIAVDGPAGAGKSSIAKLVAAKLGLTYIDTGAMYRSLALECIRSGIDLSDEKTVSGFIEDVDVKLSYENGSLSVFLNGDDVTLDIRAENVGKGASIVAKYPAVRNKLVDLQQKMAKEGSCIMDGRDIGTVVLPGAELKIYLTASSLVRAKRRYLELKEKGETPDLDEIEKDIIKRDEQDMTREVSPLKKAEDAIEVDTSDMSIDEVVDTIINLYEQKKGIIG